MVEKIKAQFKGTIGKIKLVLLIILLLLCIAMLFFRSNPKISVENGNLIINSLLYGRSILIENIDINGIRLVNLNTEDDYKIRMRINAMGLPKYYVGWVMLRNGNKALVYLNDRSNVAILPTEEFDILISTSDFNGLLEMLNKGN